MAAARLATSASWHDESDSVFAVGLILGGSEGLGVTWPSATRMTSAWDHAAAAGTVMTMAKMNARWHAIPTSA